MAPCVIPVSDAILVGIEDSAVMVCTPDGVGQRIPDAFCVDGNLDAIYGITEQMRKTDDLVFLCTCQCHEEHWQEQQKW